MPWVAAQANRKPSSAPQLVRIRLSVSSWRISLFRAAPSAARIAISFCLAAVRASIRLERFAHTISITTPTAQAMITSAGRI